ncbi:MAG: RtcB family protein, partial [Terriglobales bacterium]
MKLQFEQLKRLDDCRWLIPKGTKEGMRTEALIYASEKLLRQILDDLSLEQAINVACLPGIVGRSLAMPDIHQGYGFPIGGVAAIGADSGVISPGGIGFDINCGMRLIRTDLREDEVRPRLEELIAALFGSVPAGVGAKGFVRLSGSEFKKVMVEGAGWCVTRGYAWPEDLAHIEGQGCLPGADPEAVSARALERGMEQLGTLGSGNHYLEIQVVRPGAIHDERVARVLGVDGPGQVFVMLHCGSRGFGHQVGTDYLKIFDRAMKQYGIS